MKDKLLIRLENLREEYQKGQEMMIDLNRRKEDMTQTLHRISGAIQVLEEAISEWQDEPSLEMSSEEDTSMSEVIPFVKTSP